ncbi:MAG: PIN domain-containing protein [Sideroxydans sp.]|nr:PIN domain-containing protein [Sideroxydans sp.]NOT98065.1 PIN domain-containing protein [Sideroxydans sp.]
MARIAKSGVVHLDTHIVCWLYEGRTELLTAAAMSALESGLLQVSPMVQLELTYLHEIGRISRGADYVLEALSSDIGLSVADVSFAQVTKTAEALTWTRDPFDRMIVAHCMVAGAVLVSKDALIHQNFSKVVW